MRSKAIIGHEKQRSLLLNSVLNNHLSHAYIFAGLEGIGKKLISLEFSKLINCMETSKSSLENDCKCFSCSKADNKSHPDIHLFEFEDSNIIKIDQIRDNVEKILYLSPYESEYKIFIINNAERMNFNAQNAFLKSLEEPPKNTVIILITSLLEQIIPTIKSRCQIINFNPLSNNEVKQYLESKEDIDAKNLDIISKLAKGSIGKAEEIDDEYLEKRKNYIKQIINLDTKKPFNLFELAEKINADSKSKTGDTISEFFDITSQLIEDSVKLKIGKSEEQLINSDLLDEIAKFIENKSINDILNIFDSMEETQSNIMKRNLNKQLSLENLFMKMN